MAILAYPEMNVHQGILAYRWRAHGNEKPNRSLILVGHLRFYWDCYNRYPLVDWLPHILLLARQQWGCHYHPVLFETLSCLSQ